ncbi:hypothetical protein N0V85_007536 [Neurospora sp. IMI 360204]|nr:hypothetical protein N0V85_007536 [Neurospora sp. IMI 360204]
MVSLVDWFYTNPRLKRLEINKFDETVCAGSRLYNWNTILPKFKDTLHYLSMSGYEEPIQEDQMTFRFGPSRMLTCLPELEKLAYLRVPLHYVSSHRPQPLRDMGAPPGGPGDSDTDDNHQNSITAENIRQRIMTEFPPSLKAVDIIEYENYRDDEPWDKIRERETYHLTL